MNDNTINEYYLSIFSIDDVSCCKQEDLQKWISMNDEDIHALSEQDCDLISFKLIQHCLYAQFKVNKLKTLLDYMQIKLKQCIAPDLTQIKGVSWDMAEQLAIKNNAVASEMQEKILEYKSQVTASYNVINILEHLAKKIESFKYHKRVK